MCVCVCVRVQRPLELLADSDYKPWEYLPRVASRSYQVLHGMRPNLLIPGLPLPG